jgi:hypothetical protein
MQENDWVRRNSLECLRILGSSAFCNLVQILEALRAVRKCLSLIPSTPPFQRQSVVEEETEERRTVAGSIEGGWMGSSM